MTLSLVKGWTRFSHAKRGNLGIGMQDLAWNETSVLPEPVLLALHPILRYLPNKLVHFILDYHPQWVAQLQLPASDGRHKQLASAQFHSVLERLVNMPDVSCPLQLFSNAQIGHKDWLGEQTVHAMPFNKEKKNMVIVMYIHAYTLSYIVIHTYTYLYTYTYTCTYIYTYASIQSELSLYTHSDIHCMYV
jgi:hypothetical protein